MPPFSGDKDYNAYHPSQEEVLDESPSPSPSVTETFYRSVRRAIFLEDGNSESCPGRSGETTPKRVAFDLEKNRTHIVLNRTDYTQLERELTWFNPEDLRRMKWDARLIVEACQSGAQGYCLRGLEARSSEEYRLKRKQNKANVRFAVISEQRMQKYSTGVIDQDRLAEVSLDCTELSRIEAQQVGLCDEQEAFYVLGRCQDDAKTKMMGYDCTDFLFLKQSACA